MGGKGSGRMGADDHDAFGRWASDATEPNYSNPAPGSNDASAAAGIGIAIVAVIAAGAWLWSLFTGDDEETA